MGLYWLSSFLHWIWLTQGLINSLLFYANILWTYKPVWFSPQQIIFVSVVQIFVAWLNLDFGIESCFVHNLDALWKTWLQFLFPLYIWTIAGCIIVVACHSSRITELIGNRAVPLLATLFLFSYCNWGTFFCCAQVLPWRTWYCCMVSWWQLFLFQTSPHLLILSCLAYLDFTLVSLHFHSILYPMVEKNLILKVSEMDNKILHHFMMLALPHSKTSISIGLEFCYLFVVCSCWSFPLPSPFPLTLISSYSLWSWCLCSYIHCRLLCVQTQVC